MTEPICRCCLGTQKYLGRDPVTMEQATLPTAPLDVGKDHDRITSLEVLVCPECGFWEPCSGCGETPESNPTTVGDDQ